MAKKIRHELTYDAPVEAVSAMLMDAGFREQVCDYQKVLRRTVTVSQSGSVHEIVVDQVQPAHGIPSFAKKFVGDEINIVQSETWREPALGDIAVAIPGKPGHMNGTAKLTESGGVTTEVVELEVKVNIPLVGGKIEGLIADMLIKALKAENKVGRDYLAG